MSMVLGDAESKKLTLDLNRLLETRLLIQANSGGGKSWAIRKLLEVTHGKVQQIVLDIEGDFSSLREKHDFILAGKGGDIEASPRTAELLAHKVLELGVSIIIDLYELQQHDRIRFVKNFLDAMTNAPKKLWHPVLVVVDEAHIFAPESGKSESMSAVVDLATRGRKRGFAAVLATQRLSKLNKDVAAELINKMIGRTGLDIDMKRAGDELGFSKADALKLRDLEPGEFYVFGPALSQGVERITVGPVHTTHPRAGERAYVPSPPTNKVRSILAKLSDLPQEAEKELRDKQAMAARIRELESELRKQPKPQLDQETLNRALERQRQQILTELGKKTVASVTKTLSDVFKQDDLKTATVVNHNFRVSHVAVSKPVAPLTQKTMDDVIYGRCERAILAFLAMRPDKSFSKNQVGAMTEYAPGSGSFNNSLSKLNSYGLIKKQGDRVQVRDDRIDEVRRILGDDYVVAGKASLEGWLNKLGRCERGIYTLLLESPNQSFPKEDLGRMSGYEPTSGSFNNAISKLCTLGLAERIDNTVQLNSELTQL